MISLSIVRQRRSIRSILERYCKSSAIQVYKQILRSISLAYKERSSQDLSLLLRVLKSIRKKSRLSRSGQFLPILNVFKGLQAFTISLDVLYAISFIRPDYWLSLLRKIYFLFKPITIKKPSKNCENYLLLYPSFDTSIGLKKLSLRLIYRTIYLAEFYYSTVKIDYYILSPSIVKRYYPLNIIIISTIRNYQLLLGALKTGGRNQK